MTLFALQGPGPDPMHWGWTLGALIVGFLLIWWLGRIGRIGRKR